MSGRTSGTSLGRRAATAAVATATTAGLSLLAVPAATAHGGDHHDHHWVPTHTVLADDVIGPFQLAVDGSRVYVADGFANTISVISHGKRRVVAKGLPGKGSDVAGVAVAEHGRSWAYTSANASHKKTTLTVRRRHHATRVVDLSRHEKTRNPDRVNTYGIVAGGNKCARAAVRTLLHAPTATYSGKVDSHPYSVASARWGRWYVADAGGNDLLKVDRRGRVSTVAVLPPQPVKLTKAMVRALKGPACLAGVTFAFEPVPTDVEVDHHGMLWVSTLPGGPEDPSLGARGSIYRVDPWDGSVQRVVKGLLGASNVALAPDGDVYATELFGGRVDRVTRHGKLRRVLKLARPLSLEATRSALYVGTLADVDEKTGKVNAPGTVQRFRR